MPTPQVPDPDRREAIPSHLSGILAREVSFPNSSGEFPTKAKKAGGRARSARESRSFGIHGPSTARLLVVA